MAADLAALSLKETEAVFMDLDALAQRATTPYARALLETHARLAAARGATAAPAAPPPPVAAAPQPPTAPTAAQPFGRYSWDQSDKFVTVYFPVDAPTVAEVSTEATATSLRVRHARGGETHALVVARLCHAVDPDSVKITLKADAIRVRLRKAEARAPWTALDDGVDRKAAARDARIKSGDLKDASTQQLLADMYAHGTDEERASLAAAAGEGEAKRRAKLEAGQQ